MPNATSFSIPRARIGDVAAAICRKLVRPYPALPPEGDSWERYWGHAYGPELKEWLLKPVFDRLDREGKIGDLIVDAGSGARPVTELVGRKRGRRWILVDIAADNALHGEKLRIRLDVEKAAAPGALSYRKGLVRVCRFLGINARRARKGADMIVFSDILNYVDFEKVIAAFARFLKPGGRIVVSNLPMRGNQELFSENGLKDNRELYRLLERLGFEIEQKLFPKRTAGNDEAEELIVLVARKNS